MLLLFFLFSNETSCCDVGLTFKMKNLYHGWVAYHGKKKSGTILAWLITAWFHQFLLFL